MKTPNYYTNQFLLLRFIYCVDNTQLSSYFSKLVHLQLSKFWLELNKINNQKYDKQNMKKIGEIYYLDENKDKNPEIIIFSNKENSLKHSTDKNPEIAVSSSNEDCLKNLIELYYAFDNLNFLIKDESKILKSQENYYLINKEWINFLNKY